jgi:putative addiction module component (TIGR02574 family)
MTPEALRILEDVMKLSPKERAILADQILSSLDQPDEYIDTLWRKEVEDRVLAFKKGQTKAISLKEVLSKYQNK